MPDTRNEQPAALDITPLLPNSPVVMVVKDFIERLYNEFVPIDIRDDDLTVQMANRLNAFVNARKPKLIRAMREILADDAAILVTEKLPNDRIRMIGTKRNVVL